MRRARTPLRRDAEQPGLVVRRSGWGQLADDHASEGGGYSSDASYARARQPARRQRLGLAIGERSETQGGTRETGSVPPGWWVTEGYTAVLSATSRVSWPLP